MGKIRNILWVAGGIANKGLMGNLESLCKRSIDYSFLNCSIQNQICSECIYLDWHEKRSCRLRLIIDLCIFIWCANIYIHFRTHLKFQKCNGVITCIYKNQKYLLGRHIYDQNYVLRTLLTLNRFLQEINNKR